MKPGTAHGLMRPIVLLAIFCALPVAAQIRIDASLGRPPQTLSGPHYLIPETLGKLSGNNLFHSFQTFNVPSGQSASFSTVTPGIARVISRVTGGEPSQINGKIQLGSVGATPDFYLINPAGVVFGAGAALDVPGAFLVSTADSVKFSDGHFSADLHRASTFSSVAPEAFGFLGATRAAITLKDGAVLAAQSSRPISLSAGDIDITGATISSAWGGELRLAALGQAAQEVPFSGDLPKAAGTLAILNGGLLKTSGSETASGGNIRLSAGEINIDSQGSGQLTGLLSQTHSGTATGDLRVSASGPLSVIGDSQIASVTYGAGKAGTIRVDAARAYLDGQGKGDESEPTGILSLAGKGSSGNAGRVEVAVTEQLSIREGSVIASDSNAGASGNAGNVHVSAGSIAIERRSARFTGISSDANTASKGSAGSVEVAAAGAISLINGGVITSITDASGNSGSVKVSADSILIDRQGGRYTGIFSDAENESSGHAGHVEVVVAGQLSLLNGGHIASETYAAGNAGTVQVSALNLTMDRQGSDRFTGISSDANPGSTGHAGSVEVTVGERLAILNGAVISSDTYTTGNAGNVSVSAGHLFMDGQKTLFTGISSNAMKESSGHAGNVSVAVAGPLSILNQGAISSSTSASGNAGNVGVSAGSLSIDGQEAKFTGIFSDAKKDSTGRAGNVEVRVSGALSLADGGRISSDTSSPLDAGNVKVSADSILIERQEGYFTAISSDANKGSGGNAGFVEVIATGSLTLLKGGVISSDTYATGNAGEVKVSAGSLRIERAEGSFTGISSDAKQGSQGHAANVEAIIAGNISIIGSGVISSDTYSSGNAGNVKVSAGSLFVERQGERYAGVSSDANEGSTGKAGNVDVAVRGNLSLLGGGQISSVTYSPGQAGAVRVSAGTLLLDGSNSAISASAEAGSSGQTGSVSVTATDTVRLANGAELSIRNNASTSGLTGLLPTVLTVSSPGLTLYNAQISAASSGNVAASDLQINVSRQLLLERSRITTSAHLGNGGSINIRAGGIVRLDNAQMTTSVSGLQGNGGDIGLNARALILRSGFIQANTAARNATGGQVDIDVTLLLPSANTLFVGGALPLAFQPDIFGFNVIQAAAPTGVSGSIQITSPRLDLSGSLAGLSSELIATGGLGRSPCQTSGGSSLSLSGRGGLPPSARGLLRSESAQKSLFWPMKNRRSAGASSRGDQCI